MKRILLIALSMMAIIGCSKKEDDKPAFTQEQLQGRWKWVDTRLPDGKLFSQILSIQEYQRFLNKTFIVFRSNNTSITFAGQTYSGTYKLIGNTIQITTEGEIFNVFSIIKESKNRIELKYHDDFKKEITPNLSFYPGYSSNQVLNSVEIFDKVE
ncbi:hypothetical protein [Capnocytophaga granulosa]